MLLDHGLDLRPQTWVAFGLHMAGGKQPIEPGSCRTVSGMFAVIHQIVPEDLSPLRVGGDNPATAVNEAVGLIEVHSLIDISRNHGVVLP